jgi:hypothetical protein
MKAGGRGRPLAVSYRLALPVDRFNSNSDQVQWHMPTGLVMPDVALQSTTGHTK